MAVDAAATAAAAGDCSRATYAKAHALECATMTLPPRFADATKKACLYLGHVDKGGGDDDAPAVDAWRCLWKADLNGQSVHVKAVSVGGDQATTNGAAMSRTRAMTHECDILNDLAPLGVAPRCVELCVDAASCGGGGGGGAPAHPGLTFLAQSEMTGAVQLDRFAGMVAGGELRGPSSAPRGGGRNDGHLRFAREMLRFARGALRALAKVWTRRIVHRNISGKNFMLEPKASGDGELDVKVVDFDTSIYASCGDGDGDGDGHSGGGQHCVAGHLLPPGPMDEHSQPITARGILLPPPFFLCTRDRCC